VNNLSEHAIRVKRFMEKAGQTIPSKPCLPNKDVRELRSRLSLEEVLETISGLGFDVVVNGEVVNPKRTNIKFQSNGKENLVDVIDG